MLEFIKKNFFPILLLFIVAAFFYKFFLFGLIPFPGDLLVSSYEPYKSSFLGVPNKGQGADVVRQLYPWKYFTIESFKNGFIPLWNPYNFSGNPHFANVQSGTLYPLNILFFVFSFVTSWSLYIIFQYIFASFFTYLYLRQIGLGKIASCFGAVSFSFSTFYTVWAWYGNLGHALSFLPLVLFSIEKIYSQKENKKWYILFICSLVFSILAGYIQLSFYIYAVATLYIIGKFFVLNRKNTKTFLCLIFALIISLLLSCVQLIPTYEILAHSARESYSYSVLIKRLIPPLNFITILIPDFFGNSATMNYFLKGDSNLERSAFIGLWPILFFVFSFFTKKTFIKIFFTTVAIISYILTLSSPVTAFIHSVGIPFISTGLPTRLLSIFTFSAAVVSAVGLEVYLKNPQLRRKMTKIIILFAIIFILIFSSTFYLQDPNADISRRNMLIPVGIFVIGSIFLLLKIPKKYVALIIILLTVFELFYSFQKFNSFAPINYLYPETKIITHLKKIQGIERHWGYGSAVIDPNFQILNKTYSTSGYDPLYIKRYGEFVSASKNGKVPSEIPRSVADIIQGYGPSDLKENFFRQRAIDLTGIKYVLNKKEDLGLDSAFDEGIYKLNYQEDGWQIYENKNALSRIAIFGRYQVIIEPEEIIKKLYTPEFNYKNIVILEKNLPEKFKIRPDEGAYVSDISYSPNKISFTTTSSEDQIVFISDNFFPGWRAYVDGFEKEILRANYTFRAVPVERGKHLVEFIYQPFSFTLGFILSGIGIVSLIIFIFIVSMKKP